ncbi:MAG: PaaI family thioesterase [Myxococcota bacterium]|mgnify:CR=1 FL=1|nr:PaaI family thioesterase [Myxococcota bacterium]
MEHFRKLERMYNSAPINEHFKPVLSVELGKAQVRIPLRDDFHHSAGAVHGSLYFKALDDATFFAANSLVHSVFVLTARFELDLLAPVSKGTLVATAWVSGEDDRRIYAEGELHDESGIILARGKGHFARSHIALSPEVNYD